MEFSGFDWDHGNREKCRKHGMAIEVVEELFQAGLIVLPDEAHSQTEQRFRAIGRTKEGRGMFVVYTLRRRGMDKLIRPISARYMHDKEVERYAQNYEAEETPDIEE